MSMAERLKQLQSHYFLFGFIYNITALQKLERNYVIENCKDRGTCVKQAGSSDVRGTALAV